MADKTLSLPEEQAFQLSRCAISLDRAWESKDPQELVAAVNANLELWIAIRTMVMRADCSLDEKAKINLQRLAEFVANKSFEGIDNLTAQGVRSLVNVNLQICEGFLEGTKAA
jgi:flagellar biosynthesis activator protein FlaF